MLPGGPTEAIRFFAGQMHLFDIALHTEDVYLYPAYPGKVGEDHDPWAPDYVQNSAFRLLPQIPLRAAVPDEVDPLAKARLTHSLPSASHLALPPDHVEPPPDVAGFSPPQLWGGSFTLTVAVETKAVSETIFPPISSEMINAGQINHLVNVDLLGVDPGSAAVHASGLFAPVMIASMLDMAHNLVPSGLDTADTDGNILITHNVDAVNLINANDAAMSSQAPSHPTVAPGEYVNGVFDPDYTTPFPVITVPDQPAAPIDIMGQITPGLQLVAGSNSLVNEGAIVDFSPHTTMMVLGNSYQTNAIFQVNVLHDVDNIAVAAPQDLISILTGNDTLNNFASFHNYNLPVPTGAASAQFGWHVQVEAGNFYNVNVLAQTNVMVDGDVSYQTTESSFYQAVTGANHQFNGTLLDSEGQPFDLLIVLGNYHNANIINQTNVVLNDDIVKALLASENGQGLSISTGNNALTNAADISTYGPNASLAMSPDLAAHAQNAQGGAYDPVLASHVAGSGPLNVLFVMGDYYDVNVISQINALSDTNTAMQLMWGSAGPGTSSTESISTGSNQAANVAQIVDVNTIDARYVGGEQYSDSLLLQANIVTDGSTVAAQNPNALVNEVVAFLDHGNAAAIPTNIDIPGTGIAAHHDAMGGVLS